ncbi:type VII secretion target [Rhodococcoides yunnanense]|uniref:type VII secretion target n=1 Tax=Rhodococcoides yunnanense TaxID=278209 RepID=UPI00093553AA|nr:type VII secretion target [Rhodococcus yunnanensis]
MVEIQVQAAGVDAFVASAGALAVETAGAAAAATACGPAVLAPVFGLIGTEFLAAFTGTHTAHTAAVGRLADVLGSIGHAAAAAGVGYDTTDGATAVSLA